MVKKRAPLVERIVNEALVQARKAGRARPAKARAPKKTAPFGTSGARLIWSADDETWSGKVTVAGVRLEVTVLSDANEPSEALEIAWPVVRRAVEKDAAMRGAATADLREIFNNGWREKGTPSISAREFSRRMSLSGVNVYAEDGSAEVFYEDDGMFAGHSITVSLDADGEVEEATIAG